MDSAHSISSSGLEWENLALYTTIYPSSSSAYAGPSPDLVYEDTMRMMQPDPTIGLHQKNYGGGGGSNGQAFSNVMTSSSFIPVSSSSGSTPAKRSRVSYHNMQNPCCQVEGCNLDLKLAKDYHRRHRICESHSKSPKVIVAGMERRFCQQCSRFHDLSEFDDKKRSCRRRLSDHNARRRRVQPESIQPGISPVLYSDERQQGLLLNGLPISIPNHDALHMDHRSIPRIFDHCSTNPSMAQEMSAHSLLSSTSWSLSSEGGEPGNYTNMQEYQLFNPSGNFYPTQRTL